MTTFTWNINHSGLMMLEERCVYCVNAPSKTAIETSKEAMEKAKPMVLAAAEKAKDLGKKAATKKQQQQQQFVQLAWPPGPGSPTTVPAPRHTMLSPSVCTPLYLMIQNQVPALPAVWMTGYGWGRHLSALSRCPQQDAVSHRL